MLRTSWLMPLNQPLRGCLSALCVAVPALAWAPLAQSQTLPSCEPPGEGEYVLLVDSQTPEERQRLEQVLPTGAAVTACQYLDQPVIRVGTFEDGDLARSWADYLTNIEGFQTTVARPPDASTPPTSPEETPNETPEAPAQPDNQPTATYAPTALGEGYAVLVRYFDRPEIAATVQTVLNAPVGLAVYEQQPYLLVAYSPDPAAAGQVLQRLSDRQFSTFMVNSRQVVMLTPAVAVVPAP